MIPFNDLRVGNWVDWQIGTYQKSTHKVAFRLENSVQMVRLSPDLEPIPLTEGWLAQFAFVKKSTTDYQKTVARKDYTVRVDTARKGDFILSIVAKTADRVQEPIFPPLRYVHQLQNWYFALTSQELSLESPVPVHLIPASSVH